MVVVRKRRRGGAVGLSALLSLDDTLALTVIMMLVE
jgi:hypothetical protein